MKRIILLPVAVATLIYVVASIAPTPGRADGEAAPAYVAQIPSGYRDWKWISVAHEEGNLRSIPSSPSLLQRMFRKPSTANTKVSPTPSSNCPGSTPLF